MKLQRMSILINQTRVINICLMPELMIRPLFNWISSAWYWIFPDAVGFLMLMVMFVHFWETILRPLWRMFCSQCPQPDFQQSALHSRITCLVRLVLNLLIRTQFYTILKRIGFLWNRFCRWHAMIYDAYFLPHCTAWLGLWWMPWAVGIYL